MSDNAVDTVRRRFLTGTTAVIGVLLLRLFRLLPRFNRVQELKQSARRLKWTLRNLNQDNGSRTSGADNRYGS